MVEHNSKVRYLLESLDTHPPTELRTAHLRTVLETAMELYGLNSQLKLYVNHLENRIEKLEARLNE